MSGRAMSVIAMLCATATSTVPGRVTCTSGSGRGKAAAADGKTQEVLAERGRKGKAGNRRPPLPWERRRR